MHCEWSTYKRIGGYGQVLTRLGVCLEPWDLHVGAVLSLLGRKVTLAACNLATRHWLVSQADRLVRTRKRLECELEKFIHIQPTYEKYVRHYQGPGDRTQKPANPIQPKFSSRGDMNLRRLIEEVPSLLPSTKRH
jgi:hypothetical protein